ncbi:hypothetical protein [Photobacterium ganghwense]|uniref:hypothetical protein n=1 Tax=Photobacterium ganghwense TaxID=320778 RepID=UPI001A8E1D7D|nr:hypothetical protein [Photobacterium ganghwense]QSV17651.1 hypothetical protein FH974_25535 [Photobacterium ganghwense]
MILHAVSNNPDWADLEDAALAFRGISALIISVLNDLEPNTNEYQALEGIAILADLKERELRRLVQV